MSKAQELVATLERLNRKERYLVVSHAVLADQPFTLSMDFADELGKKLGLTIPAVHFCAMDYHLDWIKAALTMTFTKPYTPNRYQAPLAGNQEDVDLIVAFASETEATLILLEAKADSPWTDEQWEHKRDSLAGIFDAPYSGIIPRLVLMSPKESQDLELPTREWMSGSDGRVHHLEMNWSSPRAKVTRVKSSPAVESYDAFRVKGA